MKRYALWVGWVVVASSSCRAEPFVCQDDASCSADGTCVSGYCAFEDEGCESGLRYGEHATAGLGGQCVVPSDDSGGAETGASTSMGSSGGGSEGSATKGSTTKASSGPGSSGTESGGSMSTEPEDGSSESGDESGPTCDDTTCDACVACASQQGAACELESLECVLELGCLEAFICLRMCAVTGACGNECCASTSAAAAEAAVAFLGCAMQTCVAAGCRDELPMCTPGPK